MPKFIKTWQQPQTDPSCDAVKKFRLASLGRNVSVLRIFKWAEGTRMSPSPTNAVSGP